jgi:hypothetical protein
MRRRRGRVVLAVQLTAHPILAWSHWRRRHPCLATPYHDQQRGLALVASLPQ